MSKLCQCSIVCFLTFAWLIPNADGQITVSRADYGFNDSRFYFTGATLATDSINVGVPNADSAQVFDFRSVYFDLSYPARWSEDTTPLISGANEIQLDLFSTPENGSGLDTEPTFYSTTDSNGFDTLWYHGYGNPGGNEEITTEHPIPLFVFPMTLGQHWTGTSIGSAAQQNAIISVDASVDAYGTLRIPSGDFPALRVFVRLDLAFAGFSSVEYRYYYLTSTPFVSACFTAYYTSDSSSNRQLVQSGIYTGPVAKYDHMVAPILKFTYQGNGAYREAVGTEDTFHFELHNTGDTTALIDSVYLFPAAPQCSLTNNLQDAELGVGDSVAVPVLFKTTTPDTVNTIVWFHYDDIGDGIDITVISAAPSDVSWLPNTNSNLFVFPNPAKDFITTSSISENLSILDQLGRSYTVHCTGDSFDISSLPSGIYFVNDGVLRSKFVKE